MDFRSQIKEKKCSVIVVERVLRYSNQEKKDFDEISIANAEEIYLFGKWILLSELEKPCRWEADSDGLYHTECGNIFYFDNGTVEENKQKFCGYCGKLIKPVEAQVQKTSCR